MTPNKRLIAILLTAGFLLLVPLVARFPWGPFDFIVAGVLLIGAGVAIEIALRLVRGFWQRVAVCVGVLFFLLLIWAELAIGVIGTPLAGS
ncbi:MAG: hypothetical protein IPM25_14720 [Chloracidobacterium sp.]|nr:hypothetical protein [Chloracidobacterium sp.]